MDSILQEAQTITDGSRKTDYGADVSFQKLADICKILNVDVTTPAGSCMFMILVKVLRESFKHKRDNLVDLCGYARLKSIVEGDENEASNN